MRLYCDTNVFRYFSSAFANDELPQEIREAIAVSSISAVELLSQLCESSAAQAFAAVQALWNWLPSRVPLLDIPPVFIRVHTVGDDDSGQVAFEKVTNALNKSLNARSAAQLRDASKELRCFLQQAKLSDAQRRADTVNRMRQLLRQRNRTKLTNQELRTGFMASIATRAGIEPTHPSVKAFCDRVEAYYQYETIRLQRAIENPHINLLSKKCQNDLFDAEQLLYLFADQLCFLTTDRGYLHLLTLQQGNRIRIAKIEELVTAESAIRVMREIMDE